MKASQEISKLTRKRRKQPDGGFRMGKKSILLILA